MARSKKQVVRQFWKTSMGWTGVVVFFAVFAYVLFFSPSPDAFHGMKISNALFRVNNLRIVAGQSDKLIIEERWTADMSVKMKKVNAFFLEQDLGESEIRDLADTIGMSNSMVILINSRPGSFDLTRSGDMSALQGAEGELMRLKGFTYSLERIALWIGSFGGVWLIGILIALRSKRKTFRFYDYS